MSLILATGSNIGDRQRNLFRAQSLLEESFNLIKASQIYKSDPVEYLDQDYFYNQVLEFSLPPSGQLETFKKIQDIEKLMKRKKVINKGPRNIDIDIIFFGLERFTSPELIIPHHSWSKRSFVVQPLKELPFYDIIKQHFDIPETFESKAEPIKG